MDRGGRGLLVVMARSLRAGPNLLMVYSSPKVDRIWLWLYYNKIPIYPVFYLRKGDSRCSSAQVEETLPTLGCSAASGVLNHNPARENPPARNRGPWVSGSLGIERRADKDI